MRKIPNQKTCVVPFRIGDTHPFEIRQPEEKRVINLLGREAVLIFFAFSPPRRLMNAIRCLSHPQPNENRFEVSAPLTSRQFLFKVIVSFERRLHNKEVIGRV
ncbi:hypothetical protein CEXT_585231 [Caerostris extrusa]|uniref:Ribosomal protein S10 n=1 Tax=Caerostris extrusa TaxID=172846 RepID=A0AAV4QIH9_CAEEX|nr:hypothetical protein CEXT_585231 [Caerostris extrusa]